MNLCKHKIMLYEDIRTKPLKNSVDTLESMDREPAELHELDYVLRGQPWYSITFPETIEYDAQNLLKLAEEIDVMLLTAIKINGVKDYIFANFDRINNLIVAKKWNYIERS